MLCKPEIFGSKATVGTWVPRSAKAPGSLQTHVGTENSEGPVPPPSDRLYFHLHMLFFWVRF